jgi:fatty-acid desaturase
MLPKMFTPKIDKFTIKGILYIIMLYYGVMGIAEIGTNFVDNWYWIPIVAVYTSVVWDVFRHRILTHNTVQVDPDSVAYKIMLVLLYLSFDRMAPLHIMHHLQSDTINDPEIVHPWWSGLPLYTYFFVTAQRDYPIIKIKNDQQAALMSLKWFKICDSYNTYMILCVMVILAYAWEFGFMLYGFHVIYTTMFRLGHNVLHVRRFPFNYRYYKSHNKTYNNIVISALTFFTAGVVLHNNHHTYKYYEDCNHAERWYEIDLGWYIGKYLLGPAMEKKDMIMEKKRYDNCK